MAATATVRLGRENWISAATATLLEHGVDAVQITRLATGLNASRGSFYWHFTDRADLLNAVLDNWHAQNGRSMDTALKNVSSLSEAVLEFFSLWLNNHGFSAALEQAVRDWAQLDDAVMKTVQREDQLRIKKIRDCFVRFKFEKKEALVRARILYFAQIGYYAMHMDESMHERLVLTELYYASFTGRKLNTKVAKAFFERIKQPTEYYEETTR